MLKLCKNITTLGSHTVRHTYMYLNMYLIYPILFAYMYVCLYVDWLMREFNGIFNTGTTINKFHKKLTVIALPLRKQCFFRAVCIFLHKITWALYKNKKKVVENIVVSRFYYSAMRYGTRMKIVLVYMYVFTYTKKKNCV